MRIAMSGNATDGTSAYAIQARQLLTRLKADGHDVAMFAYYGHRGSILNIGGITHYPAGALEYNADVLVPHAVHHRTDLLITLHDLHHVVPENIQALRKTGVAVWHWVPVDGYPLGVSDQVVLKMGGGQPIAMSRFGQAQMQPAGLDPWFIPHAIDTAVFTPADPDRRTELRRALKLDRRFVVMIVAMNKDLQRKGFWEGIAGFAKFHGKHKDAYLYLHTVEHDRSALDIGAICRDQGLTEGEDYEFTIEYALKAGLFTDPMMAQLYQAADVLLMPSWAEGFGLPAIEAQACGVPVIASNNSALTEHVKSGLGWLVATEEKWNFFNQNKWRAPLITGIAEALERAHAAWKGPAWETRRARVREFALRYDADLVYGRDWSPRVKAAEYARELERPAGDP